MKSRYSVFCFFFLSSRVFPTPLDATGSSISVLSTSSSSPRGDLEASATPTSSDAAPTETTAPDDGTQSVAGVSVDFQPPWEAVDVSCDDWLLMDPSDQWGSVKANDTLETFRQMYLQNQLLCEDCYGMSKTTCSSTDAACDHGLGDLSMAGDVSRWDQALGIFAQSQSDLNCNIQDSSQCSQAPQCSSEHGPAGLALLKSMTTLHNSLSNIYMAIDRAHSFAGDQMDVFSGVFAPVKSLKNKAIFMDIMFVIAGVLAGCIPGIGWAAAAGLVAGVGGAVVMNTLIFDQPSAPDTATVLGQIVSNAQGAYSDIADALFTNGTYAYASPDDGQEGTTISWTTLMSDGKLLQQVDNATDTLEQIYERLLYQQLAVYTWENLEEGDNGHIPFIAFENHPCGQSNSTAKDKDKDKDSDSPLEKIIDDVTKSDTNITYNGNCYYLLDGMTVKHMLLEHRCVGRALPGGTNKDLKDYSDQFAKLSLGDFIIPSVKGWESHGHQNGAADNTGSGQIFTDPQDAGTVNFPVCDFVGNPDNPGVGCPKFGKSNGTSCFFYDQSYGVNKPGEFNEGWCGVHIEQWKPDDGGDATKGGNQISVTVADDFGRDIGSATKQSAAETLDIIDSSLPYDLFVATGASPDDPIRFWYSGQYWNSTSKPNQCSVGSYDGGSRKMDCGFHCKKPTENENPPPSATISNPFPNTPVPAAGGNTTYLNTFTTHPASGASGPRSTNKATPTATPM